MKNKIIGIDPGMNGAIAILDFETSKVIQVLDMPLKKVNGKNKIDSKAIFNFLKPYAEETLLMCIEKVSAMPDDGVTSAFKFGYGAGVLEGIAASLELSCKSPRPVEWKSALGLTSDKKDSLAMARRIFPEASIFLKLNKHDGRAEALLLIYFAMKQLAELGRINIRRTK